MSGPFSKKEAHHILGGHFISSPLGLVEKSGEPGKFRIVHDLSFKNEDGYTINSWLDADNFPTEWGTAAQIAEIVSISLLRCSHNGGAMYRDGGYFNDHTFFHFAISGGALLPDGSHSPFAYAHGLKGTDRILGG